MTDTQFTVATIPFEPVRDILRTAMDQLFHVEVTGLESIPESGGAILVCNHTDNLDPMIQGLYSPRRIHFLGKEELFRPDDQILETLAQAPGWSHPVFSPVRLTVEGILRLYGLYHRSQMETWGGHPIRRAFKGDSAKDAVAYYQEIEDQMLELLKEGHLLSIFPEGTRSETGVMASFKPMTARLALKARVPIIPSGIRGAHGFSDVRTFLSGEVFQRGIYYNVGNPIQPSDFPDVSDLGEKAAARALTEDLQKQVYALTLHPERRSRGREVPRKTRARQL
ncbi:MAG: 1-acyl-sn-glycerol-3-phosphate acyltransferase [Spirochaetaceae bacterium]|nr:1-acyl-sn-glycerol-3-phosphate acyltransferase [Spirochaetaceae bacterium]|tara:strand:+ start:19802 stop:20644 length:843 start_codon:yes stop_codon:yes gene_type:complete